MIQPLTSNAGEETELIEEKKSKKEEKLKLAMEILENYKHSVENFKNIL